MEHLINSRLSRDQSPAKLENLSPEKFGKSAYASLTYTPSKLADNVLYRQVSNLKKIEEECSKVRESQAFNSLLKDRLSQITQQRDGIEQTLTKQVLMYKKMLNQNESKHQQRIRDIQRVFNQEMQKLILAKEEQAKFAQSEKELLEGRIYELENEVSQLKNKLEHGGDNYDDLSRAHQKLEIHFKNTCQKLQETERRNKQQAEKAKAQYQDLSRKLYNTEVQFKGQIDKLNLQRQREKQSLDRLHKTELQKVENKRLQEAMIKNQQLKDLTATFEGQANRLKDIITSKERTIENLSNALNDQKQKIIQLTKAYTTQITNLTHEKGRYKEEIDNLNAHLAETRDQRRNYQVDSQKNIAALQATISKLKDQIQLNHVNFIRQKDKTSYILDDMHRENLGLKSQNDRFAIYASENAMLCKEIRNLKDLLLESSLEMQRCKQEFLRIGRQKDHLAVKVRELGFENETLHRMKVEKDQQARGWRQSYYLSRR